MAIKKDIATPGKKEIEKEIRATLNKAFNNYLLLVGEKKLGDKLEKSAKIIGEVVHKALKKNIKNAIPVKNTSTEKTKTGIQPKNVPQTPKKTVVKKKSNPVKKAAKTK